MRPMLEGLDHCNCSSSYESWLSTADTFIERPNHMHDKKQKNIVCDLTDCIIKQLKGHVAPLVVIEQMPGNQS